MVKEQAKNVDSHEIDESIAKAVEMSNSETYKSDFFSFNEKNVGKRFVFVVKSVNFTDNFMQCTRVDCKPPVDCKITLKLKSLRTQIASLEVKTNDIIQLTNLKLVNGYPNVLAKLYKNGNFLTCKAIKLVQ